MNEVYFHGTSKEYVLHQLVFYGVYRHDELCGPILLTSNSGKAEKYAQDRSRVLFTGLTPVKLMIRLEGIERAVFEDPVTTFSAIDYLLPEEFKIIELD